MRLKKNWEKNNLTMMKGGEVPTVLGASGDSNLRCRFAETYTLEPIDRGIKEKKHRAREESKIIGESDKPKSKSGRGGRPMQGRERGSECSR